jgi:hypothetical protein
VAFLGLGGVGETPETRWSRPPVTAACWPTVGAPSGRKMEWEVVKSGKGGSPLLHIVPRRWQVGDAKPNRGGGLADGGNSQILNLPWQITN